jgi:glycosyltransferase involved in cell wall biosynthesis
MTQESNARIAILGSVGVPARYGGFETLAEQLVRFHAAQDRSEALSVYCSARAYRQRAGTLGKASLRYSRLAANGASSVLYDATCLRDAASRGTDVALLLGVSGAIALPSLARRGMAVVTHVDGLEWHREKWSRPARAFLRWSEKLAVTYSDAIIADSQVTAARLRRAYGINAEVIAYGGDHATRAPRPPPAPTDLPEDYALALCRIEPENNVEMILQAFLDTGKPLVFVGNWDANSYGRGLKARYASAANLHLLDPVYEAAPLHRLRHGAALYVHGHSAGGTNPSLVEMMHFGVPVLAYDCTFNRETTANMAQYFDGKDALGAALSAPPRSDGAALARIAHRDYRWEKIGAEYFDLFARLSARQQSQAQVPPQGARRQTLSARHGPR